jgi:hypothetical protein
MVLCIPWPLWTVSRKFIVEGADAETVGITASDSTGDEILSYVDEGLRTAFLSKPGQTIVSSHKIRRCYPLIDYFNDYQVIGAMTGVRSTHINRLRGVAASIFGEGFSPDWFPSKFSENGGRGAIKKLQDLLGLEVTPKGKKYALFPPILYPYIDGSKINPKDAFLNPTLWKVSFSLRRTSFCIAY